MSLKFGGPGTSSSIVPLNVTLQSGECWTIPSGWQSIKAGKYTVAQYYDSVMGIWRTIGAGPTNGSLERFESDGVNFRLANQTGCAVGALLTTAGSGYTTAPTVVASAGGSKWQAIIGGALNTSVTVSNGGTGYTYPPTVIFAQPPALGIQATGYCTIAAGVVTSVTVTDQGAGYSAPPTISFINDPREGQNGTTVGSGASAVATLTGAGTVTAVICLDHGTGGQTAVPTLTFGSGSAAATVIMCWSITAYMVSATTAGSGYVAPVLISAYGGFPATSPAYTNVTTQSQLVKGRNASILAALSTGAITATGQTVNDGGVYPGAPTVYVQSSNVFGAGAVAAVFTAPTMGGQIDISEVFSG